MFLFWSHTDVMGAQNWKVEAENMCVKEEPPSDVNDEENEVSSSEED